VVGTKGELRAEPAQGGVDADGDRLATEGGVRGRELPRKDQVAADLASFAECVRTGREPEPSGPEGLADVRVIQALERSARTGRRVRLSPCESPARCAPEQVGTRPPSPELLHAPAPSAE